MSMLRRRPGNRHRYPGRVSARYRPEHTDIPGAVLGRDPEDLVTMRPNQLERVDRLAHSSLSY